MTPEAALDHVMTSLLDGAWRFLVRKPRLFLFILFATPFGCGYAAGAHFS